MLNLTCDFCHVNFTKPCNSALREHNFCSLSCSAKFNNQKRIKNPRTKTRICKKCYVSFVLLGQERLCKLCQEPKTPLLTKGELFAVRSNWQSARSAIQKLARKAYFESKVIIACNVCGYATHVEVAHIKSVQSFSDNSTIQEINSLHNLVALCPNHHWEFDNGIITL